MKIHSILLIALMAQAVSSVASVCEVKEQGVAHSLVIEEDRAKIVKFSYFSQTLNAAGYTCEVNAERGKENSSWTTSGPDGSLTHVEIPIDMDEKIVTQVVEIEKLRNGYRLKILEPRDHRAECGLNGYLAPSIVLKKNSKRCKVED